MRIYSRFLESSSEQANIAVVFDLLISTTLLVVGVDKLALLCVEGRRVLSAALAGRPCTARLDLARTAVETALDRVVTSRPRIVLSFHLVREGAVALADPPPTSVFRVRALVVHDAPNTENRGHAVSHILFALSSGLLLRISVCALVAHFEFLAGVINFVYRFADPGRRVVYGRVGETVAAVETKSIKVDR